MTALDVADGDGGEGHGAADFACIDNAGKIIQSMQRGAIYILRRRVDLARNFMLGKGSKRCIKLLAAWLLQGAAPYNYHFPQQN
ncbi:hypothetical protein [Burkholderia seminalis]|uniref:hypothetical protein n=1 Tax=Burkholderia seminalis TaxID=488731 RepID=UPI001428B685|nr:hypothetical protein [Burkholderia seminalis]MCA8041639.1 hypothetical protein [Burkholderia seminalis]